MSSINFFDKENLHHPKTPRKKKATNDLFFGDNSTRTSPLKSKLFKSNNATRIPLGGKDRNSRSLIRSQSSGLFPSNKSALHPNKIFVQQDNSDILVQTQAANNRRRRPIKQRSPIKVESVKARLANLDDDEIEIIPQKQTHLPFIPTGYTPFDDSTLSIFKSANCTTKTAENSYHFSDFEENERALKFKEINDFDFNLGRLETTDIKNDDNISDTELSHAERLSPVKLNKSFMNPTLSSTNRSSSSIDTGLNSTEDNGLSSRELEDLLDF